MSSDHAWLDELLGVSLSSEGERAELGGRSFVLRDGVLRDELVLSSSQAQTSEAFDFKWKRRDTFESPASLHRVRTWLLERYGDVCDTPWWGSLDADAVVLDAGCGAGMSALELFGDRLRDVHYLGVDVSSAVDVAKQRFAERCVPGAFLQTDLTHLPLADESVDVVFSEGVIHHTDDPSATFARLAACVRPGGRILFYVYRRKGPIREFTDDYVRDRMQELSPDEGWDALMPLSKLGQVLGDLDVTVDVPERIDLLDIPAGPISLQRLVYWHVIKAFHHPDLDLQELNHINYDWFAPRNAHRQSVDEVRAWCETAGLAVEHERVEDAGITMIARRS